MHQGDVDDSDPIGEDDNNGKCQGLEKEKNKSVGGPSGPGSGGAEGPGEAGGGAGGGAGGSGGGDVSAGVGTGGGGGQQDHVLDRLVTPARGGPATSALAARPKPEARFRSPAWA
ncbi:MAG: hypothetical protein ACRDJJ_07215 [Actinomycetota bacterium]